MTGGSAYTVRHGGAELSRGVQAAESSCSSRHSGDRRGTGGASGFPERGGQAGCTVPGGDCPELEGDNPVERLSLGQFNLAGRRSGPCVAEYIDERLPLLRHVILRDEQGW
jgi:hypothetical protein